MTSVPDSSKNTIPPLAAHFAQQTGHDLIQRDIKGRPYMLAGPMFFIFSYWLFQTGGLIGFGLRQHIGIISKLVFGPDADAKETERYLSDESAALLSRAGKEPVSLLELYLAPLLASVGIDFYDREYIEGKKSSWAAEKQYDMDTLDKNAYLALRQGMAMGSCHAILFEKCWKATYAAEPEKKWLEAYANGVVDSPKQEILLFPDEASSVLGEVAEWAKKSRESGIIKSEIETISRIAKEYKSS
jgi:hypothetical protein